jgi:tubulin-specific chaperone D
MRGILFCISTILKTGQRETLLKYAPFISECIAAIPQHCIDTNSLSRKLVAKIHQRIALCYLKPRIASWRYQRGNRSLLNTLGSKATINNTLDTAEEEDIYVDESVEAVIGELMEGLQDRDTIVRWSCAKGVGRITDRLPKDFAQDVIDGVLDLFSENIIQSASGMSIDAVADSTWHGACLALAEFARRGLLLPAKLDIVIPWVALALKFDQRRGSHSVGAHVRDAACYVCWSFARAYAPEVMTAYVHILAKELVIVSVFDREVNIRRASSASFQENVGRQGIFPNGIDIIVIADYMAVGNRGNSFLQVAKQIGAYKY